MELIYDVCIRFISAHLSEGFWCIEDVNDFMIPEEALQNYDQQIRKITTILSLEIHIAL